MSSRELQHDSHRSICTKESHFVFKNKYYDRNDGLAMGSPFGPLFANIFMDSFEKKVMPTLLELGVKCWLRYVDETFVIVQSQDQLKTILECLNEQV